MKLNYLGKAIGGLSLGIALLGIGAASSTTTQAQYRNDQYRNDQYRNDQYRNDQYRNDQYERQNQREWEREQRRNRRNGNYGRNGRYGDDYPDLGGSFQLRQTALNAGYNEGIKEGRRDRGHGYRDYRNNGAYRNATKDYNSRYGDRGLYQEYYRMAYDRGYQAGINGY